MSALNKKTKSGPLASLNDDYKLGDEPLLLGHITSHPGLVGVVGAFGGFITLAAAPTLLPAYALALINDWKYAVRKDNGEFTADATVSVESEEIKETNQPVLPQTMPKADGFTDYDQVTNEEWVDRNSTASTQPPAYTPQPVDDAPYQPASVAAIADKVAQQKATIVEAPQSNPVISMETAYTQAQSLEAINRSVQPNNLDIPHHLNSDGYSPVASMTDHIQNTAIIGKGGSGKGILLSNAIFEAARVNPGLKIVGIDPKNDPDETNYWSPCYKVFRKTTLNVDPDVIADWVNSAIDYYFQLPAPKLLIIDECRFLSQALQQCEDKKAFSRFWYRVDSFTSLGDSQESHVWIVSQTAHAGDLGISGGCRSMFRCIALVTGEDPNYLEALTATRFVPAPPRGIKQLNQIIDDSPVNRAIYDSKQSSWLSLAKLNNYSAKDRDTRTRIHQNEVTQVPVESNQFTPMTNTQLSFLEVEPARTPTPASNQPDLDSLMLDELDLDALMDDPEIKTDYIDGLIAQSAKSQKEKHQCLGEFLQQLKKIGDGQTFTKSKVAADWSWSRKWQKSGVLKDRTAESVTFYINAALKANLLSEDEGNFTVTLR